MRKNKNYGSININYETLKKEDSLAKLQYLAGYNASLYGLLVGNYASWISIGLGKLEKLTHTEKDNSNLINDNIETNEEKDSTFLLINIYLCGIIFGNLIGFVLPNLIGRKHTLCFATIPFTMSSLVLYFSNSIQSDLIYELTGFKEVIIFCTISRFIAGFACGIIYAALPSYLSEISTPKIRGHLNSFFVFQISIGMVIQFIIGPILSIETNALMMAIMPIIAFICLLPQPESPYFYLLKNDQINTVKSLKSLNRSEDELIEMLAFQKSENWKFADFVISKSNRKALLISFWINIMEPMSAFNSIQPLLMVILNEASSSISEYYAGIIYAVVTLISFMSVGPFLDKFGRRPVLLISCFLTSFVLLSLGVFFSLDKTVKQSLGFAPLFLIIAYTFFESFGISTLPVVIPSEIFSTELRSVASAILSTSNALVGLLFVSIFSFFKENYDFGITFCFFAFILFLSGLVVFKILPETKGKSLEEIQMELIK